MLSNRLGDGGTPVPNIASRRDLTTLPTTPSLANTVAPPRTPATPETVEKSTFQTLRSQRDDNEMLVAKVEDISSRLQTVSCCVNACFCIPLALFAGRAAAKGLQPRAAARHRVTTKPGRVVLFCYFFPKIRVAADAIRLNTMSLAFKQFAHLRQWRHHFRKMACWLTCYCRNSNLEKRNNK